MKFRSGFLKSNRTIIAEKIKEAFTSVMPITLIVLILSITLTPVDSGVMVAFLIGAVGVTAGIGLFTLGAETAMTPIGEYVGSSAIKTKKVWLIMAICFFVGLLITISEPDLHVLANQLTGAVDYWTLIIAVGVGVGIFLLISFLRILLKVKLSYLLIGCYVVVFVLAIFTPANFLPLAFDSGGVTTGPMSVPFLIAIGTGFASMRSDSKDNDDAFGITALCSVGPIIAVMILGIIFRPENIQAGESTLIGTGNSQDIFVSVIKSFPTYLEEVAIALAPIIAFFFLFYIFGEKFNKTKFIKIIVGMVYTYIGLVLFLTGVNTGFGTVGKMIGEAIGGLDYSWVAVPVGMVMGFFVVKAEPAVHVLTTQVYEITGGTISKRALSLSLMLGVSLSVGLAFLRIVTGINILYFLVPGYVIAIVLTFFSPSVFTAIAFDSGGVASGAMTASFMLPMAIGLCSSVGGNIATDGFGLVALVAMTPLIAIQILGVVYKVKTRPKKKAKTQEEKEEIIL